MTRSASSVLPSAGQSYGEKVDPARNGSRRRKFQPKESRTTGLIRPGFPREPPQFPGRINPSSVGSLGGDSDGWSTTPNGRYSPVTLMVSGTGHFFRGLFAKSIPVTRGRNGRIDVGGFVHGCRSYSKRVEGPQLWASSSYDRTSDQVDNSGGYLECGEDAGTSVEGPGVSRPPSS
jgi:hypothetical protein